MRKDALSLFWMMLLVESASAQPVKRLNVPEYGLSLSYPAHATVCESMTWTHLHGWAMPITGNCERSGRAINIMADYNAGFLRTPEAATYCHDGGSLIKGAKLALSFPNRRSATCLEEKPNGEILITVVTQAWPWPAVTPEGEQKTAYVNYTAYLWTTKRALRRDVATLRSVLKRVTISRPK